MVSIYNAIILPHVTIVMKYGAKHIKSMLDKLYILQKRAIRLVTNVTFVVLVYHILLS